ncbi:hypothetical protein SAMN05216289_1129 [Dokdonella immobilis]|uniref:Uncharacterized protein n=1 Tax=Dokdonella immobilis TaxID=578942 RepID=A0A1I4XTV4_9GAMM|nr:hypothetical protein SAMN05216289_1129 [Dokdonella immobilis]
MHGDHRFGVAFLLDTSLTPGFLPFVPRARVKAFAMTDAPRSDARTSEKAKALVPCQAEVRSVLSLSKGRDDGVEVRNVEKEHRA